MAGEAVDASSPLTEYEVNVPHKIGVLKDNSKSKIGTLYDMYIVAEKQNSSKKYQYSLDYIEYSSGSSSYIKIDLDTFTTETLDKSNPSRDLISCHLFNRKESDYPIKPFHHTEEFNCANSSFSLELVSENHHYFLERIPTENTFHVSGKITYIDYEN